MSKPSKRGGFRWIVAALFFLAYMIAGADRANIGVVVYASTPVHGHVVASTPLA